MPVAVHATTSEGMRRAIMAGAETIEHGDGGTPEIFKLMAEHHVALCPTLAASEATARYAGWKKGQPETPSMLRKQAAFRAAIDACMRARISGGMLFIICCICCIWSADIPVGIP